MNIGVIKAVKNSVNSSKNVTALWVTHRLEELENADGAIGVIKAVKNSVNSSKNVTALWVTHRLEELENADGAVYMEDGRVVMHGDASSIKDFIEARQTSYIDQINS
ncbi:unnamed protein product [Ilex paraguariensis]|uniref:Uncharacterized protein n=1 Tax=Ilex paraguariensis TaxID=185542 RepID=A0ABC8RQ35_9AQUA